MKYYIKKYQNPSGTLNEESSLIESTLPEIIIEPAKWQKEYIQYFPESVRKDINYKHWLRTDDVKKRLYDVWNTYGRPKINEDKSIFNKLGIIGKKRPNVWGNAMYNVSNYPHLLAELSHFVQENKTLKWLRDLPETLDGELSGTQKHYRTPGHYEYEAHKVIEPAIKNYIEKGEVIFNLPETIITQKQGGSIHIKEKNKGKFTESAKRAGKSVQEHARDVVNNPKATKLQKKRAQFALNAKKFKH